MDRELRPVFPYQSDRSQVLHDETVHPHGIKTVDKRDKRFEFLIFIKRVDGNIDLHLIAVAEITNLFQRLIIEI